MRIGVLSSRSTLGWGGVVAAVIGLRTAPIWFSGRRVESAELGVAEYLSAVVLLAALVDWRRLGVGSLLAAEAFVGTIQYSWVANFGIRPAPAVLGFLFLVRAALAIGVLQRCGHFALPSRVAVALVTILGWDLSLALCIPYICVTPIWLPVASGRLFPFLASGAGIATATALWLGIVSIPVLLSSGRLVRFLVLVPMVALAMATGDLLVAYHAANRVKGPVSEIYCVTTPRLSFSYTDSTDRSAFFAELRGAFSTIPADALVVLPEGSIPKDFSGSVQRLPLYLGWMRQQRVLAGIHYREVDESGCQRLYNGVGYFRHGIEGGRYYKEMLMPFGEFVPRWAKGWLAEEVLSSVGVEFTPGTNHSRFIEVDNRDGVACSVAPLICVESFHISRWPELWRWGRAPGRHLIVVLSDGERFRSERFNQLQSLWSRLLALSVGVDVLHVATQADVAGHFSGEKVVLGTPGYFGDHVRVSILKHENAW